MVSSGSEASGPRGLKRKQNDSGAPRLTPSQRLAAARKAGIATKVDPARLEYDDDQITGKAAVEPAKATTTRDADDAGAGAASREEKARRDDEDYETLYASELDFEALGKTDGDFGALLTAGKHLDFTDPVAVMQLTKSLLKRDFELRIELPDDRLCPPVPNRHNYILWLKALLDTSSPTYADAYEPGRQVTGLDVGTGASAIYPLLGCAQRKGWSFLATDIDAKSLGCARRNVARNHLESRIEVVERSSGAADVPLLPLDELDRRRIDFVMTNPPFYESEAELRDLAAKKALPPTSACTGAPHEIVYSVEGEGGEVGFIQRLLDESLALRERVQWYTAMVGKQSSLGTVVDRLRAAGIDNYAVAQFVQGRKTRRWAVGWSFGTCRPAMRACRGGGLCSLSLADDNGKSLLPPTTEMTVASKRVRTPALARQLENTFWTQLEDVTDGLDLVAWNLDEERLRGVGFADGNVWGRAYRRQKRRAATTSADGEKKKDGARGGRQEDGFIVAASQEGSQDKKKEKEQDLSGCAFGFSISIQTKSIKKGPEGPEAAAAAAGHEVVAVVRWLQGVDFGLFESFCGMLRNGFVAVTN
ncbi:hypothetical protein PG999_008395 [Apiospora kogelbergensis]|uniref:U6 small nuclear RNA (adenine-(43)-N(6))-methyltransferase n=1 Tax=Apiospora kogelbergensis TaxID=1337665 RepID=A0AAW0QS94_9PEZI